MGDDWTRAIWNELVKDKPEHCDLHDALRLGKRHAEDPSSKTHERPGSTSPLGESRRTKHNNIGKRSTPRNFVDAREWEGKDPNRAVDEGHLTFEQASSIMRLRRAIAKPVPHDSDEDMVQSMWQHLTADWVGTNADDHELRSDGGEMIQSRSKVEAMELKSTTDKTMEPPSNVGAPLEQHTIADVLPQRLMQEQQPSSHEMKLAMKNSSWRPAMSHL